MVVRSVVGKEERFTPGSEATIPSFIDLIQIQCFRAGMNRVIWIILCAPALARSLNDRSCALSKRFKGCGCSANP